MAKMHCINILNCCYLVLFIASFADTAPSIDQIAHKPQMLVTLTKRPLICEFFEPKQCEENNSSDINNCHYNKTCNDDDNYCFTTWVPSNDTKEENKTSTGMLENISHPAGYHIKRMDCVKTKLATNCEANCIVQIHGEPDDLKTCCCVGR